jgi:hypothetical protein
MTELQVSFGQSTFLQSVPLDPPTGIAKQGFVTLFNDLRERAERVSEVQSIYTEQPISLHMYGVPFGKNAYEALQHIAQTDGLALKCCAGLPQELKNVVSVLREPQKVIVDLSAVATIRLLGLESGFASKRQQFQITQATWVELQETLGRIRPERGPSAVMAYANGAYVWQEITPEELGRRRISDEAFLTAFQENVEVIPGMDLETIPGLFWAMWS